MGDFIAALYGNRQLLIWNVFQRKFVKQLIFDDTVDAIAISKPCPYAEDRKLLVAAGGNTMELMDVESYESVKKMKFKGQEITSCAFSSDSEYLALGFRRGFAMLIYLSTLHNEKGRVKLKKLTGHVDWVTSVSFSPDATRLLTTSRDYTAKLWDLQKRRVLRTYKRKKAINSGCFSPDGHRVALSCSDGSISLWDAELGTCYASMEAAKKQLIREVQWSPTGAQVACCSPTGVAMMFDTYAKRKVRAFAQPEKSPVHTVCFSCNGTSLVTGSNDGVVRVWNAYGSELLIELSTPKLGESGGVIQVVFDTLDEYETDSEEEESRASSRASEQRTSAATATARTSGGATPVAAAAAAASGRPQIARNSRLRLNLNVVAKKSLDRERTRAESGRALFAQSSARREHGVWRKGSRDTDAIDYAVHTDQSYAALLAERERAKVGGESSPLKKEAGVTAIGVPPLDGNAAEWQRATDSGPIGNGFVSAPVTPRYTTKAGAGGGGAAQSTFLSSESTFASSTGNGSLYGGGVPSREVAPPSSFGTQDSWSVHSLESSSDLHDTRSQIGGTITFTPINAVGDSETRVNGVAHDQSDDDEEAAPPPPPPLGDSIHFTDLADVSDDDTPPPPPPPDDEVAVHAQVARVRRPNAMLADSVEDAYTVDTGDGEFLFEVLKE